MGEYDEDEQLVDEALAESFPASDPPWWTPGIARAVPLRAPAVRPPSTDERSRAERSRAESDAEEHGGGPRREDRSE